MNCSAGEIFVAGFIALAVALISMHAVDDVQAPKMVLVKSEWRCRRSHTEVEAASRPAAGGTRHELVAVTACDDWDRR